MRKILLTGLLLYFAAWTKAQWLPSQGLDGAVVADITILDSLVFICANQNGLYARNVNGGEWELKTSAYSFSIEKCKNALFTWSWYSCERSLDQGLTWQNISNTWNLGTIISICMVDSSVFISSVNGMTGMIYRSDDLGNSLFPVMNNLPALDHIPRLANGDSNTLFCYQTYTDNRLFRSLDKGMTWDSISLSGLPSVPYQTSTISSLGETIWLSTTVGLYKKNSSNTNWILVSDTLFFEKMGIMNGDLFGTASGYGLLRLHPVMLQWMPENTGLESMNVNDFCTNGSNLFVATDLGPYKCTTPFYWLPYYDGLNQSNVTSMAFLGDETWAVIPRGTFISSDQGATFTKYEMSGIPRPDKFILTDSVFYAIASGSFYWSHDHGLTWTKQNTGLPSLSPPALELKSMVCLGGHLFLGTNMGLYRSSCQQINWIKITSIGAADPVIYNLYSDDSTILAEKTVYTNNYNYYTFRSNNLGQSFDSIIGLPTESLLTYAYDGIDFYGLTNYKLFVSPDDGISWNELQTGSSSLYGYLLAANKPALIVGGSKLGITLYDLYLAVTYNDGLTWTDIQDNLPVPQWPVLNLLEINQQRTFVSPSGKGLWYRDGLLTGFMNKETRYHGNMKIYPNPAFTNANLIIELQHAGNGQVFIHDLTGNLLHQSGWLNFKRGKNVLSIDLKDFAAGLYVVSFRSEVGIFHHKLQIMD